MNEEQNIYKNQRLLIISNNSLSTTHNNGKTILSFFDSMPSKSISQLYFENTNPSVQGYQYFRLSDQDVIKGIFSSKKRGRQIEVSPIEKNMENVDVSKKRGTLIRIAREFVWLGKWKSPQLIMWLDNIQPTTVFFVGGDSGFAYNICKFIIRRYHCRLTLYITDDYIMPRVNENFLFRCRRNYIFRKMRTCVATADSFVTVSETMRQEYRKLFDKDSFVISNITESMAVKDVCPTKDMYSLIYAGSLYYGRDKILGEIAKAISQYNRTEEKKAKLYVYTNNEPDIATKKIFEIPGSCAYAGSLSKDELRIQLNKSDILVFVESFEKEQIEKVRFSFSTKVTEYLSVGRPIFAVGPREIGSMDYLEDVAICSHSEDCILDNLLELLSNVDLQEHYGKIARDKYISFHDKKANQEKLLKYIFIGER